MALLSAPPTAERHPSAPATSDGDGELALAGTDGGAVVGWRTASSIGVAAVAALGIFEIVNVYLFQGLQGRHDSLATVLMGQVPWWGLWMVAIPPTIWLARVHRFEGPRWRRSVAVHAVAGLAISLAHVTAFAVAYHLLARGDDPAMTLEMRVRTMAFRFWFQDIITYCAAVGVYYAFEYFARFRRTAVAAARSQARSAKLELDLIEARLHALRMELNPHFLFNALNAVSGLVRRREHDAAIDTLERLGDLLRTTLDRDMPAEISLAEELALLQRFVDIELIRFGERLRVTWEIEPEVRDALVPPLILQPLVENALRHGISRRPGTALVRIAARRAGGQLELSVRDTGEGLAPHGGQPPREGIGLSNTRARLAELYGADATSLELTDVAGGGARARLLIPFHVTAASHGHIAIGA